jgi:glycopeptide antibiotics resistance protein
MNVAMFVPLGLLLSVVLREHAGLRGVGLVLAVTFVGFAMSLAIEVIQVFMVSRASSLLDLVFNTLGTLAGTAVSCKYVRCT